jgi:hypothetical protein
MGSTYVYSTHLDTRMPVFSSSSRLEHVARTAMANEKEGNGRTWKNATKIEIIGYW